MKEGGYGHKKKGHWREEQRGKTCQNRTQGGQKNKKTYYDVRKRVKIYKNVTVH